MCCCRAANRRVRHGRGGERSAGGRRREEHRGVRPAGERGHPVALRAGRQQTVPEVPRGNRQTDRQTECECPPAAPNFILLPQDVVRKP